MERNKLITPKPSTRSRLTNATASTSTARSSAAVKRDSLAAELEKDPQLSTAKRQQRTQVFTSTIAHANLERQLVSEKTTKMELESKLREREVLVERLERDRRWLVDREKEEKEEREQERREWEEEKTRLEADLRTIRTQLSSLREEHADLLDSHHALSHTHAQSSSTQQSLMSTLQSRASELESSLTQSHTLTSSQTKTIAALQSQIEDLSLQNSSLSKHKGDEESMTVVRNELERQAGYLRDLERTNAKLKGELNVLRERHASIEVLREEKRALEIKLGRMEEMREQVAKLGAEVEEGRRMRESWAQNAPASASATPVSLSQTVSALRLTHARLLEEHGSTTAQLRSREAELASVAEREAEAQTRMEQLESEIREAKSSVERKEGRLRLAEREVGFMKAMMASYTLEQQSQNPTPDPAPAIPQSNISVAQLESLLDEYKSTNADLTNKLEKATSRNQVNTSIELEEERKRAEEVSQALATAQTELQTLRTTSSTLTAQIKSLEDANEDLEQTLHELRGEIAGGRHVPPGVRVLCLKQNPESEWAEMRKEAVERVRGENEALLKRVKELEGQLEGVVLDDAKRENATKGEERSRGMVPRESWELVCQEKEELEDVVRQKEKRLLRLKQIFESKGAEFRDAIASILGVKLAFFPNGNVRATSIYDLTTSFVFQPTKAGQQGARMQLVAQGEGGPQDLPSLMEFWIEKEQCIPGFMASVALECYDYAKRQGGI